MISILFGAGASFGSEMPSVKTPPLGNHLFLELDKLGGFFNKLDEKLKDRFLEFGFEAGMLEIRNNSSVINPLQNELASYLSKFIPTENSAYTKLFSKISDLNKVFFITLNYDLLIEISLRRNGINVDYNGKTYSSLLKLHGSSSFVPDIQNNFPGLKIVDCGSFVETDKIKVLSGFMEIDNWCYNNQKELSPVMCMYNKEKRMVICRTYFNEAKKRYSEIIDKTNTIVIVGVKYVPHDKHVWDVILSREINIILVDPYPDDDFIKSIRTKKIALKVIERSFFDSVDEISKLINLEINNCVS